MVNFNPRSPHRERPIKLIFHKHFRQFQSTLPSQGATVTRLDLAIDNVFQSTLPSQGATQLLGGT